MPRKRKNDNRFIYVCECNLSCGKTDKLSPYAYKRKTNYGTERFVAPGCPTIAIEARKLAALLKED